MKKKSVMSPKTALMTSVLSMLLCITMFVGTTYAWFSSGFTNTQNNIMAGTLDVALEYYDTSMITSGSTNGNWVEVDENTKIFDPDAKYEPGYTEVVYLRVVNKGSLALKYQLGVSVNSEQQGINKNGEQFKLSDYIMFGVADTDVGENTYQFSAYNKTDADRKAARDSVADTAAIIGLGYRSKPAVLNADTNKIDYLTMVVYMPETVGNEANAQPGKEASINLAIDLFAAQTEYEDDSFGIGYDKDAVLNKVVPAARVYKTNVPAVSATLGMNGPDYGGALDLDASFKFKTTDTYSEAQASAYRYWHADFVVKSSDKVVANSIALAGYYEAYCDDYNDGKWVALVNDGMTIGAGEEIRLLSLMLNGGSMSYQELCNWVPVFECGVADLTGSNAGSTLTVELRLYEVLEDTPNVSEETGNYVTIGVYTHTFGDTTVPVADVTEVIPEDVTATLGMGGSASTFDLDCQFVFKTTDTLAEAEASMYRYYHADFVVSADKDVADGSIALVGYYSAYCDDYNNGNWVALVNDGADIVAGEEIRLLELLLDGGSMNYQELCNWVPVFECGAADLDDSNAGTTLTVELRLYEVSENGASTSVETGNYITIGVYTHTFS